MDIITAFKERRSINFFDSTQDIPHQTLKELLEIANLTPSSYNLQPWEVIVITDKEKKKVLRECAFNQPKVEEASAVLIIIANPEALEQNIDKVLNKAAELGYINKEDIEKQKKAPYKLYGEKDSVTRKLFAVKNTSFFAMSIMIAAKGLGLETHPMDGINEDLIKQKFNIEKYKLIPLLIAVGYPKPDLKLLPRAFRRPIDDFVKFDP